MRGNGMEVEILVNFSPLHHPLGSAWRLCLDWPPWPPNLVPFLEVAGHRRGNQGLGAGPSRRSSRLPHVDSCCLDFAGLCLRHFPTRSASRPSSTSRHESFSRKVLSLCLFYRRGNGHSGRLGRLTFPHRHELTPGGFQSPCHGASPSCPLHTPICVLMGGLSGHRLWRGRVVWLCGGDVPIPAPNVGAPELDPGVMERQAGETRVMSPVNQAEG